MVTDKSYGHWESATAKKEAEAMDGVFGIV
jgi:hypothetical protein